MILECLGMIQTMDELINMHGVVYNMPEPDKVSVRQHVNNNPVTPYRAVMSVLVDNDDPNYEQLFEQLSR